VQSDINDDCSDLMLCFQSVTLGTSDICIQWHIVGNVILFNVY